MAIHVLFHAGRKDGVLCKVLDLAPPGQPLLCFGFVPVVQAVVFEVELLEALQVPHRWRHARQQVVGRINALDAFQAAHAGRQLAQAVGGHVKLDETV